MEGKLMANRGIRLKTLPFLPGVFLCLLTTTASAPARHLPPLTAVLTFHNDNARTGQNTNEAMLTLENVNTNTFGKLFSYPVDGQVYAQPLVLTNVAIPGKGTHNVLFTATSHDSVYAFDADNNQGANANPLWMVSFINPAAGVSAVRSSDVLCQNITPEMGITGTPVIDPGSGTLFVAAKTKETSSNAVSFAYRLHALDVATGAEKFGGPVLIQAAVPGVGDGSVQPGIVQFDARAHLNRPGLMLLNGVVYVAFGSHCDYYPAHGWLFGYDAHTLACRSIFNTTPNGSLGCIWQGGGGPAADAAGNIYLMTGNGTFDPPTGSYGDSFLKFSTTKGLAVDNYFTPYNQAYLNSTDRDLGAGGAVVLPDAAGTASHRHLAVGSGKQGTLYLVDRDNLGHFNATGDTQIVQAFPGALVGCASTPAYFNGLLFYGGVGQGILAFPISQATIGPALSAQGPQNLNLSFSPGISANGTNNAIAWMIQADAYLDPNGPAILRAYNATNLAQELYDSAQAGARDAPGPAIKFSVPTVANGKVYVGAQYAVSVFGTASAFVPVPVISPNCPVFTNSIAVSITDSDPGAVIAYTLDGSAPVGNAIVYTGPFVLTNSATVKARAFDGNAIANETASATFLSLGSIGSGPGLTGAYYSEQVGTFFDPPTLIRTDPIINFEWNDPPDPSISLNAFSVRWCGYVQPRFSETYIFDAIICDGVRLWVNDRLIIDEWWQDWAPTEWTGSIALEAGKKYPIKMEFYQSLGVGFAELSWSSPSQPKALIPREQLYPATQPAALTIGAAGFLPGGQFQLQVSGPTNQTYVLQGTTDFVTWRSLSTNAITSSPFTLTDPRATNFPFRFYRAMQLP
jgi:hypothetical protein